MNAPAKFPGFLDPVKEAKAVAGLREAFGLDGEDAELLADVIEGQTSLNEVVDKVLERMADADVMIAGIDTVTAKLDERRLRYETRNKNDRALLEQAMSIAELAKMERPTATLSLAARAPSLSVTEESEIPAKYWKPGTPTLDKKALTADLKERAKALAAIPPEGDEREAAVAALPPEIPGATLNNGAPSITIRRS